MADRLLGAFMIALGSAYIYGTKFIRVVSGSFNDPLGPRAFPIIIGILAIAFGVLLFLKTLRKSKETGVSDEPPPVPSQPFAIVVMSFWMLLYYLAFEPVGMIRLQTKKFLKQKIF